MRLKFRTLVAANTAIFMSETMIGRLGCMKKKQGPAGTEAPAGPSKPQRRAAYFF